MLTPIISLRYNELKKINGWTAIVCKVRSLIIESARRRKKLLNNVNQTTFLKPALFQCLGW